MSEIMLRIIVTPHTTGKRGRLYAAALEDGTILGASRQPLLDGARALVEMGYAPDLKVTMRHAGKGHDSFRPVTLGAAARLTVREDDYSGLRTCAYRARSAWADAGFIGLEAAE